MSRSSGSKRKAVANTSDLQTNVKQEKTESDEVLQRQIDDEIEKSIIDIKSGTHGELVRRSESLLKAKEKRVLAADRHRKNQIKNINQLYEYEVEDANALYNKAFSELQEQLIVEVSSERNRLLRLSQRKAANGIDTNNGAKNNVGTNGRSMRSLGLSLEPTDNNDETFNHKPFSSKPPSGKKTKVNPNSMPTLNQVLPESSMRSDFLEIVRDLQGRAAAFENSKPKKLTESVKVKGDLSEFIIGNTVFAIGDLVIVFSVLSQENLHGMITAISYQEIVVRTGTGARFSVLIGQIMNGRVLVKKDVEATENINTLKNNIDIQKSLAQQQQNSNGNGNT